MVSAKKKKFKKILQILNDSKLSSKLANNPKFLDKIARLRAKIDKFTMKYAPEMRGRNIKELIQYFGDKKFLIRIFKDKVLVKMNNKLYKYDLRVDLFEDENGKLRYQIRPVIISKNPPIGHSIPEKDIDIEIPNWRGNSTMVLTNLSILKRKHPKNYQKIVKLLKGLGPIIDASQTFNDYKAIDRLVEKKFDRNRYNSLFIFGGPDVIPFGEFKNPVRQVDSGDLDRIVYSDDYYGDFNHDKCNDWEIM